MTPIMTGLGDLKTILKSLGLIVIPIPNITIPKRYGTNDPKPANCWGNIKPMIAANIIHNKKF